MQNSEPAKHEQLSNIVSCEMQCSKVFCQQTLESFQISFHMRNNVARYFVNKHTSTALSNVSAAKLGHKTRAATQNRT